MVTVKKEGVLLSQTTLPFEDDAVLNPAVTQDGDTVHLLYRAVRKGNYSTVGYCKLTGPLTVAERSTTPLLIPEFEYESHGVEDPRLTRIDDLYYLTYTAYNGLNALGCLATSTDLIHFERLGVVVPRFTYDEFKRLAQSNAALNEKYLRFNVYHHSSDTAEKKALLWDKNVIFFPRRINGKLWFLHRIKPDIQVADITELSDLTPAYWENYFLHFNEHIVLSPRHPHEVSYIGGGCPPIETEKGWILIYHGVHDTPKGYVYSACAALLDLENPSRELARLPYPLFRPELDWEVKGEVNNVVFPTGTTRFGDTLYIYYGAADKRIACASLNITDLLNALESNIPKS